MNIRTMKWGRCPNEFASTGDNFLDDSTRCDHAVFWNNNDAVTYVLAVAIQFLMVFLVDQSRSITDAGIFVNNYTL